MSYREGEKVLCKLEGGEQTGTIITLSPKFVEVQLSSNKLVKVQPKDISSARRTRARSPARGRAPSKTRRSSSRGRKKSPTREMSSLSVSPSPTRKGRRKASAGAATRRSLRLSAPPSPPEAEGWTGQLGDKLDLDDKPNGEMVVQKLNHEKEEVNRITEAAKEAAAAPKPVLQRQWLVTARHVGMSLGVVSLLPALSLGAYLVCTKRQCSLARLPTVPSRLSSYLHVESLALSLGWLLLQVVLCFAPVGRVVVSSDHLKYRLNGLHQLLVSLAVIGGGIYLDQPMIYQPIQRQVAFITASHLICLLIGLVLWLLPASTPAQSISWSGTFLMGKEVNPRLAGGRLDVKQLLMRLCLNTLVALDMIVCALEYRSKGSIHHGVLMLSLMQLALVLVLYLQEESMLNTALVSRNHCGYLMVAMAGAVIPSLCYRPVDAWHTQGSPVPLPLLIISPLMTLVALGLLVLATQAKQGAKGESLSGKYRRPLALYSGWGLVRHPNYSLLLTILLSWNLAIGWLHASTWLPLVVGAVILGWRSVATEKGNAERYGNVWNKYTDRVRSRMIPKIF